MLVIDHKTMAIHRTFEFKGAKLSQQGGFTKTRGERVRSVSTDSTISVQPGASR